MISICCATYNHAKYLSETIEGFVNQITSFKYEILIHDDASTDGTADIIRHYTKLYPNIIRPIYQIENQYSKGVGIHATLLWPNTRGKYIAQCEGDDYWTNPHKLQTQLDFMESNPDCTLCVHKVNRISATTNEALGPIQPSNYSRYFSMDEIIKGGGGLFGTNSMLFRTSCLNGFPKFLQELPVGDYPLVIQCALKGSVFYINSPMAVSRRNAPKSWTVHYANSPHEVIKLRLELIDMLNNLDKHTNYTYSKSIQEKVLDYNFRILLLNNNYSALFEPKYKKLLKNRYSFLNRIKLYLLSKHILN